MRLTELLKTDEVTISCELFPPKQGTQLENYKKIVKEMADLKPSYISVTYGATGGTLRLYGGACERGMQCKPYPRRWRI